MQGFQTFIFSQVEDPNFENFGLGLTVEPTILVWKSQGILYCLVNGNPDSVQVCRQAHSNKMWVIQFILKTDEGLEINFVVIL